MFERKPPTARNAPTGVNGPFADEDLTEFSWDDLIARLGASQDLRASLAHVPATARASFDAQAAEHLANRRGIADRGGKYPVNPVALANGKAGSGKDGSSADSAWPTVRGIK